MGFAFIVREVATTDHAFMCCSLVVVGGVVVVVGFAFIASYLSCLCCFPLLLDLPPTHPPNLQLACLLVARSKIEFRLQVCAE